MTATGAVVHFVARHRRLASTAAPLPVRARHRAGLVALDVKSGHGLGCLRRRRGLLVKSRRRGGVVVVVFVAVGRLTGGCYWTRRGGDNAGCVGCHGFWKIGLVLFGRRLRELKILCGGIGVGDYFLRSLKM